MYGMNLNTRGNNASKSYKLIIKLKIEGRESIIQLRILSASAVGIITLESLYARRHLR